MTATLEQTALLGSTEPRLWTPPLRELTPDTSAGFACIKFAEEVLQIRLMAWQKWFLIHALETHADGNFRFTTILLLVARQNGKTLLCRVLVLWFLYVHAPRLPHAAQILTAAQDLRTARKFWQACVDEAEGNESLADEIHNIRYASGEQTLTLVSGAEHMLTATTRGAGRGGSTDLLLIDEFREQRTTHAWAALQSTTAARPHSLTVLASNQGDDESICLNDLRVSALAATDPSVGIFEWSAEDGSQIDDVHQWARANPSLGRMLTLTKLRSIRASSTVNDFRTENLCQRVDTLNNAIDLDAYRLCRVEDLTLQHVKDQLVACIDVSADETHVDLAIAAPVDDGQVKVIAEMAGAWGSVAEARAALAGLLEMIRPRALGWYPQGSAGSLAVDIEASHGVSVGRKHWDGTFRDHSPGVVGITGADVNATCMAFADLVLNQAFQCRVSPLLDDHISQSAKYETGESGGWRFARKGSRPISATYAVAGAVHLARSLPPFTAPPLAMVIS